MKKIILNLTLLLFVSFLVQAQVKITAPNLGNASSFTILAGTEINNTSNTEIEGNVGVYSGTVFTGSATANITNGTAHLGTPVAAAAQTDLALAYQDAAGRQPETGKNLTAQNLGGKTLKPGIYTFNGAATLDGTLTLDNNNDPTAVFIFQIDGDFTITNSSVINFLKDFEPRIPNVFWQVKGSATIGAFSLFKGTLMARQNITAGSRVSIGGRLHSLTGAVNLSGNTITIPADLAVTKTKTPGAVRIDDYTVGEQITFTITAINNGPIDKSKIRVLDNLPSGLTMVSATPSVGTFDAATSTWNIPYLANKAIATLKIVASASSVASQRLVTYSVIEIDEKEEISDNNNTGTISLCIIPDKVGAITGPKSVCVNQESANTEYTYSVAPVNGARFYNWITPAGWIFKSSRNTNTITVMVPVGGNGGKLSVTAGSTCGESEANEIIITASSTPSPAPGPITSTKNAANPCAGEESRTYSIDPVNGAESYVWTFPSDWIVTSPAANKTSITVTVGKAAGEIKVIATNSCGPSLPSTLAVTPSVTKPAVTFTITGGTAPCINENNSYSISPVEGATAYEWVVSANIQIISGQGTRTIIVKPLDATPGTITAKAINGCGETTASINTTAVPKVATGQITGTLVPCLNVKSTYSIDPVPGALSYNWTVTPTVTFTGQGTTAISLTPSEVGAITIQVEAVFNCGPNAARSIIINPLAIPAQPAAITSSKAQPCENKDITLTVPAVPGATSYAWDAGTWAIVSGQGTTSITLKAGATDATISVKAVNSCGESAARILLVKPVVVAPAAPLTIQGLIAPCIGSISTVYVVNPVENASNYIWTLPNSTWKILEGDGTTSIKVKVGTGGGFISVRAGNDCANSGATTLLVTPAVTVPVAPGPITAGVSNPCISAKNITYSITPVAGATSYEWSISGTGWKINTGQGTISITVDAGTTAGTLEVKAVNGCGSGAASTLTVNPITSEPPTPVKITGPSAPCLNQPNLTYSIDAVAGAIGYMWFVTGNWKIVSGQNSTSIVVNAGSGNGTISVIATNSCGQSSAQSIVVSPAANAPTAPGIITGITGVCVGQANVTYSVAAASGVEEYEWTLPTGWKIISGNKTNSITVEVGSGAGKIVVTAKNGCGQASSELPVAPTIATPANPGVIVVNLPSYCAGETNLIFSVAPVTLAAEYIWTLPAGWNITQGQGTNSITVTAGAVAGNIKLEVKNSCGSSSATLAVNPLNKPTKPVIIGSSLPCINSSGNVYSVALVPDATEYIWEVPAGWKITSSANTNSITVEAGSTAGDIKVKIKNSCGESEVGIYPVNIATDAPVSLGPVIGSSAVCSGVKTLTYSVAPIANVSGYSWSLPAGWKFISGEKTATVTVEPNSTPGIISVMAENGCGKSTVSVLAVQITGQLPVKPGAILTNTTKVCADAKEVIFSIGAVNGATNYVWETPAGWVITEGQGTTKIKVTIGTTSGSVIVKAGNGCGLGEAQTIVITPVTTPEKPIAIKGDKNICVGSTVEYSVAAVIEATEYNWEIPAGWQIIGAGNGNKISVKVGNASGKIKVLAKNTCGSSAFAELSVNSSASPSPAPGLITPGNEQITCTNQDNLTYTIAPVASANYYVWKVPAGWKITAGDSTTTITVKAGSQNGVISVLAGNGCGESTSSTLAVTLTQTNPLVIGAISGQTSVCSGQEELTYSVTPVPGATTYEWSLPEGWEITDGKGTPIIKVKAGLKSGQISVIARNNCAASTSAILALATNVTPLAPAQIKDLSSTCTGLSYSIAEIENATGYTWTLPPGWTLTKGEGTNTIQVNAPAGSKAGTITVTATSSTGCSSTVISFEANPALGQTDLTIANVFSPNADGVNDKWEVTNIQNYPENDLVIINRWGSEVYRRKGYQNNWDGGDLSAGTYYYVLNVKACDGTIKTHKGYVMIMR